MSESRVRVAVRVRPPIPREQGSANIVSHPSERQICLNAGAKDAPLFTYDNVFNHHVSQRDLYVSTAARMMQPFLDGYHVTILAYGQTSSGKTYSMGSDSQSEEKFDDPCRGLVPRFLQDLFASLNADDPVRLDGKVTVSFLEIYGEEIHDLLVDTAGSRRQPPPSLQVMEDKTLGVHVPGLTQVPVGSLKEAMQQLANGVKNRTTAETLMNVNSSRSHAVYTVTLVQTLRLPADDAASVGGGGVSGGGGSGGSDGSSSSGGEGDDDNVQVVTSKLTFVDLAGSERLGRTMAEGKQMREGININQGLLALGTVINALCEQEEKAGRSGGGNGGGGGSQRTHVPYRQSKLTRLLQDALGGNSQTLFLACVSPAADSYAETLSTLHYANRARNIKNKPVKNAGSDRAEARRLRVLAAALQAELVLERFCRGPRRLRQQQQQQQLRQQGEEMGPEGLDDEQLDAAAAAAAAAAGEESDGTEGEEPTVEELLRRAEVKRFLEKLGARLAAATRRKAHGLAGGRASPLQPLDSGGGARTPMSDPSEAPTPPRGRSAQRKALEQGTGSATTAAVAAPVSTAGTAAPVAGGGGGSSKKGTDGAGVVEASDGEEEELPEGDPEQELAILDRLIEWQRQSAEYDASAREEQRQMDAVDVEIREKEDMLVAMRDTLQGYHAMRQRYETVLAEAAALKEEQERLKDAAAAAAGGGQKGGAAAGGGRKGGAAGGGGTRAESEAARLTEVSGRLARSERELLRLKHSYQTLQKERDRAEALEVALATLKQQKVAMMKRKREEARVHREFEQRKNREIQALRRSERRQQKQMGSLELEVRRQRAAVQRRNAEVGKIGDKLAKAEEHVLRLLSIRKHEPAARRAVRAGASRHGGGGPAALLTRGDRSGCGSGPKATAAGAAVAASKEAAGPRIGLPDAAVLQSQKRVDAAQHALEAAVQRRLEQALDCKKRTLRTEEYARATGRQIANLELLRQARDELRKATAALKQQEHCEGQGQENKDPVEADGEQEGKTGRIAGSRGGSGSREERQRRQEDAKDRRGVALRSVEEAETAVDACQAQLELLAGELEDFEAKLRSGKGRSGKSGSGGRPAVPPGRGSSHAETEGSEELDEDEEGEGEEELPRELAAVTALDAGEARELAVRLWKDLATATIHDGLSKDAVSEKDAQVLRLQEELRAAKELATRQAHGYTARVSLMESENRRELVRLSMMDPCAAADGGSGGAGSPVEDHENDGLESAEAMDRVMGLAPLRSPQRRRSGGGSGGGGLSTVVRSPGAGLFSPLRASPPRRPASVAADAAAAAAADRRSGGGGRQQGRGSSAAGGGVPGNRRQSSRSSGAFLQVDEALIARQRQLEKELGEAAAAAAAATAAAREEAAAAAAARARCNELAERLAVTEQAAAAGGSSGAAAAMLKLQGLWAELGIAPERRQDAVDRVASAAAREAQRQAEAAAMERDEAASVVLALRSELASLQEMLGQGQPPAALAVAVEAKEGQAAGKMAVYDGGASAGAAAGAAVDDGGAAALLEQVAVLSQQVEEARRLAAAGVRRRAELRRDSVAYIRATGMPQQLEAQAGYGQALGADGGNKGCSSRLLALLGERRFVCGSALHREPSLSDAAGRTLVALAAARDLGPDGILFANAAGIDAAAPASVPMAGLFEGEHDGPFAYVLADHVPQPVAEAMPVETFAVGDSALEGFRLEVKALALRKAEVMEECREARDAAAAAAADLDITPAEVVALCRDFGSAAGAAARYRVSVSGPAGLPKPPGRTILGAKQQPVAAPPLPAEAAGEGPEEAVLEACAALICDSRAPLVRFSPARTQQLQLCAAALAAAAATRRKAMTALVALLRAAHVAAWLAQVVPPAEDPSSVARRGSNGSGGALELSGDAVAGGAVAAIAADAAAGGASASAPVAAAVEAEIVVPAAFGIFLEELEDRHCALSAAAFSACQMHLAAVARQLSSAVEGKVRQLAAGMWEAAGASEEDRIRFEASLAAPTQTAIASVARDDGAMDRVREAAAAAGTADFWLREAAADAERLWRRVEVSAARLAAAVRAEKRLSRRAEGLEAAKGFDRDICELVAEARTYVAARDPKRLCERKKSAVYLLGEERECQRRQVQFSRARRGLLTEIKAWEAIEAQGPLLADASDGLSAWLSSTAREIVDSGVNGEKLFNLRLVQRRGRLSSGDDDVANSLAHRGGSINAGSAGSAAAAIAVAAVGPGNLATPGRATAAAAAAAGGSSQGSPPEAVAAAAMAATAGDVGSSSGSGAIADGGYGEAARRERHGGAARGNEGRVAAAAAAAATPAAAPAAVATPRRAAGGAFAQLLDQSRGLGMGQLLQANRLPRQPQGAGLASRGGSAAATAAAHPSEGAGRFRSRSPEMSH